LVKVLKIPRNSGEPDHLEQVENGEEVSEILQLVDFKGFIVRVSGRYRVG